MEVIIHKDIAQAVHLAGELVAAAVRRKPRLVLGLVTGSTMTPFFAELARRHREERLDFGLATTFNLDEFLGVPPDHPCSCHREMRERLFRHVNLDPSRTFLLDGMASNVAQHCRDYEERIRDYGGIDLQILGVGVDGHIGFNEPTSSLGSRTRRKSLMEPSRRVHEAAFGSLEAVPRQCVTMGIGTILESRQCLLLAFGEAKAEAVAAAVEGPVSCMVPASALQFHPDARFILDTGASSLLKLREYYNVAYGNGR